MTRAPLVSTDALIALAQLQPAPAVAWLVGTDLTLQALEGPLTVLLPAGLTGQHLYQILGTDRLADPTLGAVHRALGGERVSFTAYQFGHHWQGTTAPLGPAHRPLGVVGVGTLLEDAAEPGEPCRYVVARPSPRDRLTVGDNVVILPERAGGRCYGMFTLHPERVIHLLLTDHLRPVTQLAGGPASPPAGHEAESPGPPPGARPARGPLRLEREG